MRTTYKPGWRTVLRDLGGTATSAILAPVQEPDPPAVRRPSLSERLAGAAAPVSSLEPKHPRLRHAGRAIFVLLVVGSVTFAVAHEAGRFDDFDWRFEPAWIVVCIIALIAFEACHIELWRFSIRSL